MTISLGLFWQEKRFIFLCPLINGNLTVKVVQIEGSLVATMQVDDPFDDGQPQS